MSVGEESAQQIKLRAERLGGLLIVSFYLYAETNMQSVRAEVERIQPNFLIIDSIQTIMSPEISGVQGIGFSSTGSNCRAHAAGQDQ